jgi:hypothetical protein
MNSLLSPIGCFLTFVKIYCWLPLLFAICIYGAVQGTRVFHSALSDDRNYGTGLQETIQLTHRISRERFAKRDVATMIYVFGLPSVIALLVLSLIYGWTHNATTRAAVPATDDRFNGVTGVSIVLGFMTASYASKHSLNLDVPIYEHGIVVRRQNKEEALFGPLLVRFLFFLVMVYYCIVWKRFVRRGIERTAAYNAQYSMQIDLARGLRHVCYGMIGMDAFILMVVVYNSFHLLNGWSALLGSDGIHKEILPKPVNAKRARMSLIAGEVLWGTLIVLFGAVFIFTSIVHSRMMRKLLEKGSIFSPSLLFRAMGTRDFYLFIVMVCILALLGVAMKALKDLGLSGQ